MNLYHQRVICLYLDPRATLTIEMKDSEEQDADKYLAVSV